MAHKFDYDYFVIGGGSGGVRSARIAASHGAKVGIAEGKYWGGTCVNVGCVPKKLFTYAADYGSAFEDARGYGWSADNISFDWKKLIQNKDKEIERLNGIYKNILKSAGVTSYEGYAFFKDKHTIVVNNKEITSDKFLIAVGGTPRKPVYEGAEHTITSDEIFFIDKLPEHIVIEGAGYIAVEFAHIFHGLGVKTTIIYRGNRILREFDAEIADFLTDEMKSQGINIILNTDIEKVERQDGQYLVHTNNNNDTSCNMVLSAIGRIPNTEGLGLENAKIETAKNNSIIVDKNFQTNHKHIYAVGDVINRVELTPVAITEGHILADKLFSKKKRKMSYENIPTAIFSNPQIGTVGLSEEQAIEDGYKITVFRSKFKPMRHTLSGREERTLMKLIVDQKTDKILGAHMCGTDAAEMMQGIGIALQCGATKADFDTTVGIHPTSAEEWVTMRG